MLKEKEVVIRKAMIWFDAFIGSLALFIAYFLWQHFYLFYKFRTHAFYSSRRWRKCIEKR